MKKKAIEYSLKAEKKEFEIMKIRNSIDAVEFARKFYHDDINIYESAFIVLLNRVHNTIGYARISQGGICGTTVDSMLVCKYAIESLASGVILVHNHPSGNTNPSIEDKNVTIRLRDALKTVGSKLCDSIVLTDSDYLSMTDEGFM